MTDDPSQDAANKLRNAAAEAIRPHDAPKSYDARAAMAGLGLWALSVREAATLVAVDMWFAGELEEPIELPESEYYAPNDPRIRAALSKQCAAWEKRLITAIDHRTLKAEHVRRDFRERLDAGETYLDFGALCAWLRERGHEPDEAFADFSAYEFEVHEQALDVVIYWRAQWWNGARRASWDLADQSVDELRETARRLTIENAQLQERSAVAPSDGEAIKADRPLSTNHRNSLLTIIGALCTDAGIDYTERAVAQRVTRLVNQIGARMDDETVRKILRDIPEALNARK